MDGACGLKHAFGRAMEAYLAVLDQVTLAELVASSTSPRARDAQAALSLGAWRDQPRWRISVAR